MKSFATLILAAGQGKRMKSSIPKVLHKVLGKTVLEHVLAAAADKKNPVFCVVSPGNKEGVQCVLSPEIHCPVQKFQRGTADAVRAALPALERAGVKQVLILPGDMPLLRKSSLDRFKKTHLKSKRSLSLLTVYLDDPKGYGRILRDNQGQLLGIREETDCTPEQRAIDEVNTGVYAVSLDFLKKALPGVRSANKQKEFYLTDIVGIAAEESSSSQRGKGATGLVGLPLDDAEEGMGINSRMDLAVAIEILRYRKLEALMTQGVTIEDPGSTFIDVDVTIGQDTVIHPFTVITCDVRIGKGCEIGPFTHLHHQVRIKDGACVGNYVEIKKTTVGKNSKAKHLTYLGDATLGEKVNIGAGTITANYDGKAKHPTRVRDGAHIGSNSVIVAPNVVGKGVTIGAGTVLSANQKVPDGSLVYGVPGKVRKRS